MDDFGTVKCRRATARRQFLFARRVSRAKPQVEQEQVAAFRVYQDVFGLEVSVTYATARMQAVSEHGDELIQDVSGGRGREGQGKVGQRDMLGRVLLEQVEVALGAHPAFDANQTRVRGQLCEQGGLPQQPGGYEGVVWVERGVLAREL